MTLATELKQSHCQTHNKPYTHMPWLGFNDVSFQDVH
jgi:hypothetical protein